MRVQWPDEWDSSLPVRMTAGAKALMVMPVSAYSLPTALAKPMTAALLVE